MTGRGNRAIVAHMAEVPDLVTRQELADIMRVSIATVDRLIAAGMPTIRFSPGTVRLDRHRAMMWAAERHGKAA
jgi:phage terminase Nu1 subunit (DNA packaging protein)